MNSLAASTPDRESTRCDGCGVSDTDCAIKSSRGPKPCCEDCGHVVVRAKSKDTT